MAQAGAAAKRAEGEPAAAEQGTVTVSGKLAGVYSDGDRRWISVYAPGGYCWKPAAGQEVLVLKAGQEKETACVLGAPQAEKDLMAGEVCLFSEGGSITLKNSGEIRISGDVSINGESLGDLIYRVVLRILGG